MARTEGWQLRGSRVPRQLLFLATGVCVCVAVHVRLPTGPLAEHGRPFTSA